MSVFSKTVSVAGFANKFGVFNMEYLTRTDKDTGVVTNFISCLDEHGDRIVNPENPERSLTLRVSDKVDSDLSGDLSVSWFTPENGESSWMLHPTGQSSVESKGSLSFAPAKKSADMSI